MDLNKKLEELKPYQLNCNVFDVYSYNGLSMQDLLCQFFTKINECITVSNETIDLAKWLVNEGLEIEVVKKLMIWLEDGTLENIINVNLFNTLNDKINGLSSQLEHIAIFVDSMEGNNDNEKIDNAIVNAGKFGVIKFNKRIYNITKSIIPLEGQLFEGVSSGSNNGTIINIENNDYIFDFQVGLGLNEIKPPSYQNLTLKCNNGIRHGNEGLFLPTDSANSQNYISHGYIRNCCFIGKDMTGNAIELIGQYRTPISENYIQYFNVGIRTVGCDLNEIHLNRIWQCKKALIEVLSLSSGGSQTKIIKNDLLEMRGKSVSEAMIICSDMNPIIEDNYFENGNCDSVIKLLNANNGGVLQSINILNNRVEVDASQASYFLNTPDNFNFLTLKVVNNTSRKGTNGFLQNNKFDVNGVGLSTGSGGQPRNIIWEDSPSVGVPFKLKDFVCDYEYISTYSNLNTLLGAYTPSLKAKDNCFIIPAGNSSEIWFKPIKILTGQYDVTVRAKSNNNSKLTVQVRNGNTYVDFTKFTLTNQFENYTLKNLNRTDLMVMLIGEPTNTDDILVESITIKESSNKILDTITKYNPSTFTHDISNYVGDIYATVSYSASNMFSGEKKYILKRIVDGIGNYKYKEYLLYDTTFSSSVINCVLSVTDNIINIETTGNGGEKRVALILKDSIN